MSSQLRNTVGLWREKVTGQNRIGKSRNYLKDIGIVSMAPKCLIIKRAISFKLDPFSKQRTVEVVGQTGGPYDTPTVLTEGRRAFSKVLNSSSRTTTSSHGSCD